MAKPTISQAGGSIMENKPLLFGLIFLVLLIIYFTLAHFCYVPGKIFGEACEEDS
jgi:hypothetical protein